MWFLRRRADVADALRIYAEGVEIGETFRRGNPSDTENPQAPRAGNGSNHSAAGRKIEMHSGILPSRSRADAKFDDGFHDLFVLAGVEQKKALLQSVKEAVYVEEIQDSDGGCDLGRPTVTG